jgi:DUF4097 and DUF4098 domain-containing protein YvlB
MLTILAAAVLASLSPLQGQTDTTFAVPAGASLSVNNFGGAIVVHGWNQNRVKVHAEHGSRGRIEVSLVGNTVTLRASSRQGAPSVVDFEVTVPQSMGLTLSGTYAEITVDGVQGPISAETVEGEINVRGGSGIITLHSIQGSVTLADATGRIEVNSVNEDVELSNVSGQIKAETTNGDVTLTGVKSSSVEAATINGDVIYEGTITDGGTYVFNSHNGDMVVSIPEGANVTVSVATANGDIDPSFPLPLTATHGKRRYTFKLGSGSARMEVESFQGDIKLRRPEEIRDRMQRKGKHNENDDSFDFHFDSNGGVGVGDYAARYARKYAPKYAAKYAPKYARQYARAYARAYSH